MVRISIFLDKSLEQNAAVYFEKAKKERHKIEGAEKALVASRDSIEKLKRTQAKGSDTKTVRMTRKTEWYEKFRWFISSEGFLVIGGRDATTNEIVIKKHTDKHDIVFHTDMAGSPFFVIKTEGKAVGEATMQETADATGSYSRAWKAGLAATDVFHVTPEQVSKTAQSGEYMAKGAFMIYGKTTYLKNAMRLAVGVKDGMVIGGPVSAIRPAAEKCIEVIQGSAKPSDAAKLIQKRIGGSLDEIIKFLPAGGVSVVP
jgi:predicted ribosome quality control (RQC) complex YloA/Tae2 family protein